MRQLMETYNAFDVVIVPFPFTDISSSKRRPALILSTEKFNIKSRASVMAMITTATRDPWPLDVPILDLKKPGLPTASIVRMKMFTLDHCLIIKKIGSLGYDDQVAITQTLKQLLFR